MKLRQTLAVVIFGCGSLAWLASGAAADWLVASGGSRIETTGPFKVEGKLVIFTLPNGTLGSLPLSEVDLEASRSLTAQAATEDPPADEPDRPKAVLVITDADVGHPNLGRTRAPEEDDTIPAEAPAPELRVSNWRENLDQTTNSVEISGTLENPTDNPATSIELEVVLYDEEGGLLERSSARLERGFLNPGTRTRFDSDFNETMSYDHVEFHIRSRGFMAHPPDEEPQVEGEDDDESPDWQ